jgi:hypothetical protein
MGFGRLFRASPVATEAEIVCIGMGRSIRHFHTEA